MAIKALGSFPSLVAVAEAVCYKTVASEIGVGDSQATVASFFVIQKLDNVRVQMKYHRLDGKRGTGRRPSARRHCGGSML